MPNSTCGRNKNQAQNLHVIPSSIHLAATSEAIVSRIHREKILNNSLKKVEDDYDFIVIDCPPSLGILSINAIYTADLIIIPTTYSKYSLDGIADLFDTIRSVKEDEEFKYKILRTIKDTRAAKTNRPVEELLSQFGDKIFNTIIRKNEAIVQTQFTNLPILHGNNNSMGCQDYLSLTKEVLNYEKASEN